MKATRQNKGEKMDNSISLEYFDWPQDELKKAVLQEWENGEGFDIYLGKDKIELSNQEITVLEILFAKSRLILKN